MNFRKSTRITELVRQHVKDKQFANDRSYDVIHPSAIGYCIRKPVLDSLYYPCDMAPVDTLMVFENGHAVHSKIEKFFEGCKIQIEPELVLDYKPLNISGRTDSLIMVDGKHKLVEIKSMKDTSYDYQAYEGRPGKSFYSQIQLYFFLINELYIDKYDRITEGYIICENKNDQGWQEWEVWYDQEEIDTLIEKIVLVNKCIVSGHIPPVDHNPAKFPCHWVEKKSKIHRYCDYYSFCHFSPNDEESSQGKLF